MGHTHRYHIGLKKKKKQVKSPSPESRVPETGSDPPIRSDRESGRDNHLMKNGFIPGYSVCARQGEMEPDSIQNSGDAQPASESIENAYHSMVMDAAGPDFNPNEISDEPLNPEAQKFLTC